MTVTAAAPTVTAQTRSWADTAAAVEGGVVRISTVTCDNSKAGTGVLLDPSHVLTAAHVVHGQASVTLALGGLITHASVVGLDQGRDVALLLADAPLSGRVLSLATVEPRPGDDVAALGFPSSRQLTLTTGRVSGLDRHAQYQGLPLVRGLFEANLTTMPGNSGGPVVTMGGDVVGVVSGTVGEGSGLTLAADAVSAGGQLASWMQQNTVLPAAACQVRSAADLTRVAYTLSSSHPDAVDVGQTLYNHGIYINQSLYEGAFSLLSTRQQSAQGGFVKWASGLGTSFWRSLAVDSVTGSGDVLTADARLTTVQAARYGRNGQTCSVWRIRYTVVWDGQAWRIDDAQTPWGDPSPCP
ncbi:hypothetical protein GCM10012320_24890 [Sinomonas cellulolyticus]|uniref:Trypsin-like peptidase domain-containing protein n=1 Tax=Sinomonas cellulolyticus TaxID=2801916 RepID=A0ABS1K412_9MICC|nr:trypsin-like peptidase domain-containing protein [Sinomonas cellulolyticus]GHG53898.1 hypothetical protein GCM10012320_24890 [Sinomonas sp. KCTC 49339]